MKVSATANSPYKNPGRSSAIASADTAAAQPSSSSSESGFPDFFNGGLLQQPAASSNNNNKSAHLRPLETFADDSKDSLANTLGVGSEPSKTHGKSKPTQSRTTDLKRVNTNTGSSTKSGSSSKNAPPPANRKLVYSDEDSESSSTSESDDSDSDSEDGRTAASNRMDVENAIKHLDEKHGSSQKKSRGTGATPAPPTKSETKSVSISDKPDIVITAPSPTLASPLKSPVIVTPPRVNNGKRARATAEPSETNGAVSAEKLKAYAGELEQLNEKKRKCEQQILAYEEINKTNHAALEEMAAREDELAKRVKDLDNREKMIVERESGIKEMRAKFTSLFS